MDVQIIVFVCSNVEENTMEHGDAWCRNLVGQFHKSFPHMKLKFGGRAETLCKSLDERFLKEDVANLAMLSYEASIRDGNFFPIKTCLHCTSKTLLTLVQSSRTFFIYS